MYTQQTLGIHIEAVKYFIENLYEGFIDRGFDEEAKAYLLMTFKTEVIPPKLDFTEYSLSKNSETLYFKPNHYQQIFSTIAEELSKYYQKRLVEAGEELEEFDQKQTQMDFNNALNELYHHPEDFLIEYQQFYQ